MKKNDLKHRIELSVSKPYPLSEVFVSTQRKHYQYNKQRKQSHTYQLVFKTLPSPRVLTPQVRYCKVPRVTCNYRRPTCPEVNPAEFANGARINTSFAL